MLRRLSISLLLAIATAGAYAGVRHHAFVDVDDLAVVVHNPDLRVDSPGEALRTAFRANLAGNWIPVTVLSLQVDRALWGDAPAGFLLGNAAIHTAAAVALFLALHALSGTIWRSAFVAAVFALHPLHVESVAWASMRKDVLAGLWWALALWAYAAYAARPGSLRYAAVTLCLVLGLLSKPIVVTLPCVLLLLDAWPLGRLASPATRRLAVLEKLPWFALVAAASWATWQAQAGAGAVASDDLVPFAQRVGNAFDSLSMYLLKSFWPTDLAVYYPHPHASLAAGRIAAATAAVGAASLGAVLLARRVPAVTVGWLWFLGTLVPMLGFVQVGDQARADRYTYISLVGLAIAVTWGTHALLSRWRIGRGVLTLAAVTALAAMTFTTRAQVAHWRDPVALHRRAVEVAPSSWVSRQRLGAALLRAGRRAEAAPHLERAVALAPRRGWPYVALADLRARAGEVEEAVLLYRRGLAFEPEDARAHANLGLALTRLERHAEARQHLERALELHRLAPERSELAGAALAAPHVALADTLSFAGELDAAIEHYRSALALDPDRARAAGNLGLALSRAGRFEEARPLLEEALKQGRLSDDLQAGMARTFAGLGRTRDAIRHFRNALTLRPGWRHASNDLAWLLATTPDPELRDPEEALRLMQAALLEREYQPAMLDTLAAAQAAAGDFDGAVRTADRALALARRDPALAEAIRARRALYASGRAYVEPRRRDAAPLR